MDGCWAVRPVRRSAYVASAVWPSAKEAVEFCHDPSRTAVLGYPNYPLPDLKDAIDLTLRLGARTNAEIRCAGVSLNTSLFSEAEAHRIIGEMSAALGLPVADPLRGGALFEALADACVGGLSAAKRAAS